MKSIKAVIIDDEKHCIDTLKWQLETFCPQVELVQAYSDPQKGLDAIKTESPDLLFLDVEMPGMNGFELLEQIGEPQFDVIFTTAYDKFAVKAIKISALDYLIKPIDEDELQIAVQKALESRHAHSNVSITHLLKQIGQNALSDRIFLPTLNGLEFVDISTIIRCVSDSNYTTIFMDGQKKTTVSKTLKEIEEMLPEHQFFRTHNSHIVNLKKVMKYVKGDGGHLVMTTDEIVPVSRAKKQALLDLLKQ